MRELLQLAARAAPRNHPSQTIRKATMQETNGTRLSPKALFNPNGDTDVRARRLIGGNTTNLNDFNNVKYA